VKWFYSLADYFKAKGNNGDDTKGTNYLDFAVNYDLGSGWGVVGHWGHLNFKHVTDGSYNDWKLGVTKDLSGWVFGAAYIGTDAKGDCTTPQVYCFADTSGNRHRDAGRDTLVLSVGKTF
jgi:uncharacterized protein (TIGR02001 family)